MIEGDRIQKIGDPNQINLGLYDNVEVIDAQNAVILPGFIDGHNHFTLMGIQIAELNLGEMFSRIEILDRIRARHLELDSGKPLIAYNYEFEHIAYEDRLTADDISTVAPGRIIRITDRSAHMSVTNHYTLKAAEIQLQPYDCYRKDEVGAFSGEICGVANTQINSFLQARFQDPQMLKLIWKHAADIAISHGVTMVHGMIPEEETGELVSYDECLPINLKIYSETKNVKWIKSLGLKQIGGCGKVMVDGDTGPYTAAFLEPYNDRPETRGLLYYSDDELEDYVWEAHSAGLQVALHCVGDAASEQFLNAVAHAQEKSGKRIRHRIEHFEFPNAEQLVWAKKLGVAVSLQPAFNYYWNHDTYIEQLGEERARHADPVQRFLQHDLITGFGSDCTVTPCNPLWTISCAMHHSIPEERIDIRQGLFHHTMGGAQLGCEEMQRGSITEGKIADLVFLGADPTLVEPGEVKDIPILRTMVCGETVYSAG